MSKDKLTLYAPFVSSSQPCLSFSGGGGARTGAAVTVDMTVGEDPMKSC